MPSRLRSDQRGFTLVEVLVAISVLLVGVLGVVSMIDGANAVTTKTKAREGANSVARSIVEIARAVPYKSLSDVTLLDALEARPGLNDVSAAPAYTIASRGFRYDVSLQVCSMDDPADNLGAHDGPIEFCPDSDEGTGVGNNVDRNPDDYKRIAVTLTWTRTGGSEKVKQTSLVSNPVGGLGPTVIRLDLPGVGGTPKTVTVPGALTFEAETGTDAEELIWSVSGVGQGSADPVGTSRRLYTFQWDVEGQATGAYWEDCTYVIQAEAFDDKGRAGAPRALTVVLNRAIPEVPAQLEGGRNGNGSMVDLQWKKNTAECDVLGYRVYRSTDAGGPWTQVTCLGQNGSFVTELSCLDSQAPDSAPLYYYVVGVDTDPNGALREGGKAFLTVSPGNDPPAAPTNLSACLGGTPDCNEPDGSAASEGATVVRWDPSTDAEDPIAFYRIYRDGTGYDARYAVFFPQTGRPLAWTDPDTPSGTHTYYVTAVASNFGESALSSPIVDFP